MKKGTITVFAIAALLCLLSGVSAKADDIQTIGVYNGNFHLDPGPYDPPTVVGTFNILAGDTSATISGFFGNSAAFTNSAGVDIYLGSILVAQCIQFNTCYSSSTPTVWSDTLSAAQLASLGIGPVNLTAVQTSQQFVRLGVTTLDQVTAVATPEPGSMSLLGLGVLGLAALKLSKK